MFYPMNFMTGTCKEPTFFIFASCELLKHSSRSFWKPNNGVQPTNRKFRKVLLTSLKFCLSQKQKFWILPLRQLQLLTHQTTHLKTKLYIYDSLLDLFIILY